MTKNQMRRAKKKEQKKATQPIEEPKKFDEDPLESDIAGFDISEDDPNFAMFKEIMDRFGATTEDDQAAKAADVGDKGEVFFDDDDEIPDED
ncbi:hypothetical protein DID88_006185 [Monilinia fructigena]|uniref:Uncharacterized protein n=1 Tax=Monilinia fructigena TaxID=38457 RepID=A0A395J1X7_9HELO|nr:hypothetical protein DID88_006185 [Monilinia fructigena]